MRFTRKHLGIGLLSFATLLLELGIIRAFDVILDPSVGYMVVTIAMFSLGLGGIYVYLFKGKWQESPHSLPVLTLTFAAATVFLFYALNWLPFDLNFAGGILRQLAAWTGMYLTVVLPFFLSGVILSLLFSRFADEIGGLYFADLAGAGLACLLLMLVIPVLGPGGMVFFLAGLLCLAAWLLSSWPRRALYVLAPLALVFMAYPFVHGQYIEFADHANKRGTEMAKKEGKREYVKWDPVSKVEVLAVSQNSRHFSLDGGQQSSWMNRFDGNFAPEQEFMRSQPDTYFFSHKSLAYYLKRDKAERALVLGAAVGGEAHAALLFGVKEIDAIEMVGAMVNAAKTRYAEFSGNIFNHPQVHYQKGEARTFLRATDRKYDIIQMFSNHSSSSIAQGNGALETVYLQTAEAYEEYFSHLKPDGILQINRHFYPRMLTTAALAWHKLGRKDFSRHVLVFERFMADTLPTMLVKMTPWTAGEVAEAWNYLNRGQIGAELDQVLAGPSRRILRDQPYEGGVICGQNRLENVGLMFGIYGQDGLDYPVRVRFSVAGSDETAEFVIDGARIRDNESVTLPLDQPWENMRGKVVQVRVDTENSEPDKSFSLWLDNRSQIMMPGLKRGSTKAYQLAYNPLRPEANMLPRAFLEQPFPEDLAAKADYRLYPAEDNRPFFNMVRRNTRKLEPRDSTYLDGGTALVLNMQLLPFLSRDVLGIFVVGGVAIVFAALFVFLPLRWTGKRQGKWPGMPWFLVYFSCLGAGFIVVELTLIQLCTRVIGYPTYTYAAVLFALLFSAALGSLASGHLVGKAGQSVWRWAVPFLGLLAYGAWFLDFHQTAFAHLLQYGLPLRWLAATTLIFPLGFFMGMPFPLGIGVLNRVCPAGIAWAWGMNGFFTVVGGFLSLVCAFFLGFRMTLMLALAVYVLAFLAYALMRRKAWSRV